MSEYKISIIVPVYNAEPYLVKCMDSLIHQTYKDLEIICINDESSDNSLMIIKEYALKDTRIKIIDQKNCGVSKARNAGIREATGDYIMFIDSDDWIDLNTCDVSINTSTKYNADVVFWSYIREFPNISKPKKILKDEVIIFSGKDVKRGIHRRLFGLMGEELKYPENADAFVTVWGKLYKTDIIKNNGIKFVDLSIIGSSEDTLFNIDVFQNVNKAVYLNKYFNHYRKDNQTSLTTKYRGNLFKQWNNLYDLMLEKINSYNLDDSYRTALNTRIALSIIGLGLNEMSRSTSSFIKIKSIKDILQNKRYKLSYTNLKLSYFPIHWKVFFVCARYQCATAIYLLLLIIKKKIGR